MSRALNEEGGLKSSQLASLNMNLDGGNQDPHILGLQCLGLSL